MSPDIQANRQVPTGLDASSGWRMYKVREVAALFGCTSRWVTKLINQGCIHAVKPVGGNWRILPRELERLQRVGLPLPTPKALGDDTDVIQVPQEIADRIFPPLSRFESGAEATHLRIGFVHLFEHLD